MNIPFSNEQRNIWQVRCVPCGDGVRCLKVTFSNGSTWRCVRANIYANGKAVGCGMLANAHDTDSVFIEIEKTEGLADIRFELNEPSSIIRIEALKEYPAPEYTPTSAPAKSISPELWEATDMLGRHITSAEEVTGVRPEKKVGLFYWTWRDAHKHLRPINLTKLLAEHPKAEFDPDHEAWGDANLQCHWNEPGMGFYLNSDPYVLRKHAVMLADAQIDFIVFDCTNGNFLWKDGYEPLLCEFEKAKADGINVPKIAFMLNFAPMMHGEDMLRALYQDLYRMGKYSDLWFMLDGKPLIMAYPEAISKKGICDHDTKLLNEIRDFFTFRPGQPLYYGGPHRKDHWGWLEMSPQHKYCERNDGTCEMMTVGVAQNARDGRICTYFNDEGTYGRSYTKKNGHSLLDENSYKYGYNFEEQWENALAADPDIIFITGWNEWQMGRCHECWVLEPDSTQIAFVDQYDRERSRDIEPDIDGYLDTYYLQMVNSIRKFKGAPSRPLPSAEVSIDIFGDETQWNSVTPEYVSTNGAVNRDYPGYRGCYYKNNSARNVFSTARVARDEKYLYFYAKCEDKLTSPAPDGWMTLYINSDRDKNTGWEGYDLVINRHIPNGTKAVVEKNIGAYNWEIIGEADIHIGEDYIAIRVERQLLSLDGKLNLEFKWSDNMQEPEIMDFYYNGDCAPHGRFNYVYKE